MTPAARAASPEADRLVGGPRSEAFFGRLLGLGRGPAEGWRVVSVEGFKDERFSVGLARGEVRGTLVLKRGESGGELVRSGELSLCVQGETIPADLMPLMPVFARRLRRVGTAHLRRALEQDPASLKTGGTGVRQPEEKEWCVSDRGGGNPGQWRRFLHGKEFHRLWHWAHATGMRGRILYIVHGDSDCFYFPPDLQFRGMTFLNFPPIHPFDPASHLPDTVYQQMATDIRDDDLVHGTTGKLADFSEAVRRQAGASDMVMVSWSCAPTIMGDDLGAVVREATRGNDVPVIINSILNRLRENHFSLFDEFFHAVRGRPEFLAAERDADAVNLLDIPDRYFGEELSAQLDRLGARVNLRVLPDVPMRALRRYMRAGTQVLTRRLRSIKTVERAVADLPLATVYAPEPYGLEGTRAYLEAVGEALGRRERARAAWEADWARLRPEFERLREQASRRRLAFVVDEASLPRLLDPAFEYGIPVVRMLVEGGFGLDALVYAPEGKLPEAAGGPLRLPGGGTAAVHPFRSPEELGRLLREGPFGAVYSDIYFDFRVTEAGKTPFSMRQFEPGLAGALRTLRRLLGAAGLPFYSRYARHLRAADRGRDV